MERCMSKDSDDGEYRVTGRAPGRKTWSLMVDVPAEHGRIVVDIPRLELVAVTDELAATPRHEPSPITPMRIAAIGSGAVAVAAFVGAIVFSTQANNLDDQSRALCRMPCSDEEADLKVDLAARSDRKMIYAQLSLGAMLGGAVGAILLWFNGAPDTDDGGTALAPMVTPGGGGIAVSGRF